MSQITNNNSSQTVLYFCAKQKNMQTYKYLFNKTLTPPKKFQANFELLKFTLLEMFQT